MNPNPPSRASSSKIAALVIGGLALVGTILWAVNTYAGQGKARILLFFILVFLALVLILWLLYWIIRKIIFAFSSARARRDASQATPTPGANPQEQAELNALLDKLKQAVRVIQESKLAKGRRPEEALYALPWILLLGPPESGKTTALRESGVDFPYTTAEDGKSSRSKQPATVEFWFSRGGIVLDLAGRLGADDENFDIFKGFLNQLKRARKARPLDAVVVTASLPDIMGSSRDHAEQLAHRLRLRFDEMIRRLGIRFPIYVLFTKCDQIPGFGEFFGNLRGRDRTQVWGATISRSQRKRASAEQIFQREFDGLVESLHACRLELMAGEKDSQKLSRIYNFPAGFAALRDRLTSFVGALLQPTPYSERPMFRGFYLTSAAVGAQTLAAEAPRSKSTERWEPGRRLAAMQEAPQEGSRSYFLESLFPKIIFADRPMAGANVDTRLRRRLWLDIVFVSTLLLCAVLIIGMFFSFFENRSLIETTRSRALKVVDAGWDGRRITDLTALEDLRLSVATLDEHAAKGPGFMLGWGLYSGGAIHARARHVYLQRLMQAFVRPTANALLQRLVAISSDPGRSASYDEFYTHLKAYMMMTDPSHSNASFLVNALAPIWNKMGGPEGESAALKQLQFYAGQLSRKDPEIVLATETATVSRARQGLCQYPALNRVYNNLKDEGNSKVRPFTLAHATGGKSLDFLSSTYDVPGVFTKDGWTSYFKNAVDKASGEVAKDDWVLGGCSSYTGTGQVSDAEYRRRLLDLYFDEYAHHWSKFLEGISVNPLANLDRARAALESFSQAESALSRLLMNVAENTMLPKEPEKSDGIGSMVSSALGSVGLGSKVNREELVDAVAREFQPLHDLVTSPDGKEPSPAARYILILAKIQQKLEALFGGGTQWEQVKAYVSTIANNISGDEFHDGYAAISRVKQLCGTRSTAPIGQLLEQPLRQSWAAILRDVGSRLDGLWKSRVADGFTSNAETKFPFNPQGPDLPLALLSQYLKPKEGFIWAFYDQELRFFLNQAGDRYASKELFGSQVEFSPPFLDFMSRASALTNAFYGSGAEPTVSFDLTPGETRDVSQSLLEIDGQQLSYGNWRQAPQSFVWPGKTGAPHAKLQITIVGTGDRPILPVADGEWALFRLLRLAEIVPQSPAAYTIIWRVTSADGRKFEIRYRLQSKSIQNPFAPNFFGGIACPERLSR